MPSGQLLQLDGPAPVQARQEAEQVAHVPVAESPNIPVPQPVTHDRPFKNEPLGHDVHCSALPAQVLQVALQFAQKVLAEPRHTPERNWLELQALAWVHCRQDGVLWPAQVPKR